MRSQLLRIAERHLASADPQGQRNAVAALGAIEGTDAAAALARACVLSPHADVHALAVDRLVERGAEDLQAAGKELAAHLRSDAADQRRRAWRALASLRVRAGLEVGDLGPLALRVQQAFDAASSLDPGASRRTGWGGLQAWWFLATVSSALALAVGLLQQGERLVGPGSIVGFVVALTFAPLGVAALATLLRTRVAPEHHHADPWIGWAWSLLATAAWAFVVCLLGLGLAASVHAGFRGAGLDHVRLVGAVVRGAALLSVAVAAVQLGVLSASRMLATPALSQALQVAMGALGGLVSAHLLLGGPPRDVESFTLIVAGAITVGAALGRRGIAGAVRPRGAALAARAATMAAILAGVAAMALHEPAQARQDPTATQRLLARRGDHSAHALGSTARLVLRPSDGSEPGAVGGCDNLVAVPSTLYVQERDPEAHVGRVLRVYSLPERGDGVPSPLEMIIAGSRLESETPLSRFTGPIALPFPAGRYVLALDDLDVGSFASLLYPPDSERTDGLWVVPDCDEPPPPPVAGFVDTESAQVEAHVAIELDDTLREVQLPLELHYPRKIQVWLPDVRAREGNPLLSRDRQGMVQAAIHPGAPGRDPCATGEATAIALAELREGALEAALPAGSWCLRLAARGGARARGVSITAATLDGATPLRMDPVQRRLVLPDAAPSTWLARVPYAAAARPRADAGPGPAGRLEVVQFDVHQRVLLRAALPGRGSVPTEEGASASLLAGFLRQPATNAPLALRLLDERGTEVARAEDPPALEQALEPGRYWLEPVLLSADAEQRGLAEAVELRVVVEGRGAGWRAQPCGEACEVRLPAAASREAVVATGLARGGSTVTLVGGEVGRWYQAAVRGAPDAALSVEGEDAALVRTSTGAAIWLSGTARLAVQAEGEALDLWIQPIAGTTRVPYVDAEPVEAWLVPSLVGETWYLEGKGRVQWSFEACAGDAQTGGGASPRGNRALRQGDRGSVAASQGQVVSLSWRPRQEAGAGAAAEAGTSVARPGLIRVVGVPFR